MAVQFSKFLLRGFDRKPSEISDEGDQDSLTTAPYEAIFYVDDPERLERAQKRVLITALGGDIINREAQIRSVADVVKSQQKQPIIVATHLSTEFLVAEKEPTEILPLREDLKSLTDSEYESYLNRRWAVLLGKWAVSSEISLGVSIEKFILAQRDL